MAAYGDRWGGVGEERRTLPPTLTDGYPRRPPGRRPAPLPPPLNHS